VQKVCHLRDESFDEVFGADVRATVQLRLIQPPLVPLQPGSHVKHQTCGGECSLNVH
jgi:hypothetical protein